MPCGGTELKRLALVILAILAVVIVLKAQNATPQGGPRSALSELPTSHNQIALTPGKSCELNRSMQHHLI
jgi:hypothetical protein